MTECIETTEIFSSETKFSETLWKPLQSRRTDYPFFEMWNWSHRTLAQNIQYNYHQIIEPVHEISNNVVCATSKASDQPAHTHSLNRAFASRLSNLIVKLLTEHHLECLSLKGCGTGSSESTHVRMPYCWKSHTLAQLYPKNVYFVF